MNIDLDYQNYQTKYWKSYLVEYMVSFDQFKINYSADYFIDQMKNQIDFFDIIGFVKNYYLMNFIVSYLKNQKMCFNRKFSVDYFIQMY